MATIVPVEKPTRWLNDEEQELWRLMLATRRKVERVIDDALQLEGELTTSEFAVLVSLSEAGDCSMRLRDLCSALDWDRSRTSHQITRMAKRGLVVKKKTAGDARGVEVSLTDDGMARLKKAVPCHVESVRQVIFDHMTAEQARVLSGYLATVNSLAIKKISHGLDA